MMSHIWGWNCWVQSLRSVQKLGALQWSKLVQERNTPETWYGITLLWYMLWISIQQLSTDAAGMCSVRYPAALATLADLEEVSPTESRPPALDIYTESINSSRLHYDDTHIYPYTYLGNYYYRRANYKEALRNWAEAARVISRYVLRLHCCLLSHVCRLLEILACQ